MPGQLLLTIMDVKGNLIGSQSVTNASRQIIMNVSALPAGIYFLHVEHDNKSYINKFVKE